MTTRNHGLGAERLEAFARLDLEPTADPRAVKQAYRRAAIAHPPDQDPETFRSIRAAYERLCEPWAEARERLSSTSCFVEPPRLAPRKPLERHAFALDLLRAAVSQIDARLLIGDDPQGAP